MPTHEISAAEYRGAVAFEDEQEFTDKVRSIARQFGWLSYHTYRSRRSEPGFPDICFVHPETGAKFWAELKMPKGKTTPAQDRWIAALVNAGDVVFVWKPEHWDEILDVLSGALDL